MGKAFFSGCKDVQTSKQATGICQNIWHISWYVFLDSDLKWKTLNSQLCEMAQCEWTSEKEICRDKQVSKGGEQKGNREKL